MARAARHGAEGGWIEVFVESTYGTDPSGTADDLAVESIDFHETWEHIPRQGIYGMSPVSRAKVKTAWEGSVTVIAQWDNSSLHRLIYGGMGQVDASSAGGVFMDLYNNTYFPAHPSVGDFPSLTFYEYSGGIRYKWHGGVVDSFSVNAVAGDLIRMTFNCFGKADGLPVSSSAVPSFETAAPMYVPGGTASQVFTVAGEDLTSSGVYEWSFEVQNNLNRDRWLATASGRGIGRDSGRRVCSAMIRVPFTDEYWTVSDGMWESARNNETGLSATWSWPNGLTTTSARAGQVYFPDITLLGDPPTVDGPGAIDPTIRFEGNVAAIASDSAGSLGGTGTWGESDPIYPMAFRISDDQNGVS